MVQRRTRCNATEGKISEVPIGVSDSRQSIVPTLERRNENKKSLIEVCDFNKALVIYDMIS
jgi:hypothetical protein